MKRVLMLGVAFVVSFFAAIESRVEAQEASEGAPGRYQLFQGRYLQWDTNSGMSSENNDLFLVDTATGGVFIYTATVNNGKQQRSWQSAVFDETAV